MNTIDTGKYVIEVDSTQISLSREGRDKLTFTPAEVEKISSIINTASQIHHLKALPDHIKHSPFVIRFFEDGNMRLESKDRKGSILFSVNESDELIDVFNQALAMSVDERRLNPGPRAGVAAPNMGNFIS